MEEVISKINKKLAGWTFVKASADPTAANITGRTTIHLVFVSPDAGDSVTFERTINVAAVDPGDVTLT